MKLLILGATGGTGIEIIRRSLAFGHSVTALVRSPQPIETFRGQVNILQGSLLDPAQLESAIRGQDAILSGFGSRQPLAKSDAHLVEQFASNLTAAMQRAEVKRLVVISAAFLFKNSILPPAHLIGRLFFPAVVADLSAMENIVQQSNLDWTLVRPPQLTDGPLTETYRIRVNHLPRLGFKISRADVADFFLRSIDQKQYSRKIVGISN